jgi:hypothetical protein
MSGIQESRKSVSALNVNQHIGILQKRIPTKRNNRIIIYYPDHPRSDGKYVLRHILIAEIVLGKYITQNHPVHHIDKDTLNDSNDNLIICEDHYYHKLLHQRSKAYKASGHANWLYCRACNKYDDPSHFTLYKRSEKDRRNGYKSYHLARFCKTG